MADVIDISLTLTAEDIAELVFLIEETGSDQISPVKDYLKMFITYENREAAMQPTEKT